MRLSSKEFRNLHFVIAILVSSSPGNAFARKKTFDVLCTYDIKVKYLSDLKDTGKTLQDKFTIDLDQMRWKDESRPWSKIISYDGNTVKLIETYNKKGNAVEQINLSSLAYNLKFNVFLDGNREVLTVSRGSCSMVP